MESRDIKNSDDHKKQTDKLIELSSELRERTKKINEKLADLQKRSDQLLHPDKDKSGTPPQS